MLDIKFIRENPEKVKKAMRDRQKNMDDVIDEILRLDEERRTLISETEEMKSEQNKMNKKIPAMKKAGEDTAEILEKMKKISDKISKGNLRLNEVELRWKELLLSVPNVPNDCVPYGKDDSENPEIRRWS